VEAYDPATDTWTRKKDMPTARLSLDTVAVNGRIFAIGGIADLAGGPILSTMEEYDPVKDTWMEKADMSAKRWGVSAAVVDGKIYAIGGAEELEGEQPIFPPPEVYDPATDTWTELTDMQVPRMWLSSSAVNGKIYAIGGAIRREWDAEGDNDTSAVEEFTPEDWQSVSPQGKLPTKWGEVKSD
jgi:N-acetylneuraminic acid mutarotase